MYNRLCKQIVKYPDRACLLTDNYKEILKVVLSLLIVRALSLQAKNFRFRITYAKVTHVCSWSVVRYSHLSLTSLIL